MTVSVGIDIGGSFTDFALEQTAPGQAVTRHTLKTPTTRDAPEQAVLDGLPRLLALAAVAPAAITRLIHGTTLATNALIERRGARTAFLTTDGFRDVLATGNESRAAQYDLFYRKRSPLVSRRWRLPVGGRLGARGQELRPLDMAAIAAHAADMAQGGIQSIAVGYLHAYAAADHEQRTRDLLDRLLPDIPVSLSCEVSPEIREYERFCTTVANAYVQPAVSSYLSRLQSGLRGMGVAAPMLLMLSDGGLATVETAMRFPVRLLESGPAGGAVFAGRVAQELGLGQALAFDMGGTTAKLCLLANGAPRTDRVFEVDRTHRFAKGSGMPVRVPVVELVEIGAGGGSIAHVDATGRLRVGPESAGSAPGPACFGRGGVLPTVTDANLVLGALDPVAFAGGTLPLDEGAAREAMTTLSPGQSATALARSVTAVVEAAMAAAARVHAAERGAGLADRVMIAFGGGAPLHALRVARLLGVRQVVIPPGAGVGSALGFLWAIPSYEAVRGFPRPVSAIDPAEFGAAYAALQAEASAVVAAALPSGAPLVAKRTAQLRYRGQGQEVTTTLPDGVVDPSVIEAAFIAAYTQHYGTPIPGVAAELVAIGVSVSGPPHEGAPGLEEPPPGTAVPDTLRAVHESGSDHWPVFDRGRLAPGSMARGPLLVTEAETTSVIPQDCTMRVDARGNLVISLALPVAVELAA
jgi:N-methylhydantoinase A